MGREHEDQHIYLYVCINPVAVFGKEKKTHNILRHLWTLDYTTEKKKKKKKCWLCFCLCGLGWCLIPGTSAGLGSKCGVSRGWWGCVSQCAPSPNRPDCLLPSAWAHNLQIQANPPAAKTSLAHPKNGWASGLELLWKTPWVVCLLVMGFCLRLFS